MWVDPDPPRVLLCCEAGAGRGHVTTLAAVARALGPHYPRQAILARMGQSAVLEEVCDKVDRGPHLRRRPQGQKFGALTWAGWLLVRGFNDPTTLKRRFEWWCEAFHMTEPSLIVGDFAPTALMAARTLGIRSVSTGAALGLPPATLKQFPELLTAEQAALHGRIPIDAPPPDEASAVEIINTTLGPLGLPPIAHLPEIYAADLALPRGVALWDPYADLRDRPLTLPVDMLPDLPRDRGREVFIYFSTAELKNPATREALRQLPYAACLVAPDLSPDLAQDLAGNPNLQIAAAPISTDEIVARSRVILCAGQAGTLSLAVLSGIPVLALPVQHEQLSNALRASAGLRSVRFIARKQISTEAILDALAELWSAPDLAQSAQADAKRLRADYSESALESYARLLRPLLHGPHRTMSPAAGPDSLPFG